MKQETRNIAAAIVVSAAGVSAFSFLPILTGALADDLGLSESVAGLIASTELIGFAIAALASLFWNGRVAWRPAAILMLVVLIIGNVFSIFLSDAGSLAILRFITGFASGSMYALALNLISHAEKPERAFAVMIVLQVLVQATGLAILSRATISWGVSSIFVAISLIAVFGLISTYWLPRGKMPRQTFGIRNIFKSVHWQSLAGLSLFFINIGIVWTFIERIGEQAGLEREFIGVALSVSVLFSLLGAFGASLLEGRFGRTKPIVVSAFCQILAITMLLGDVDATYFFIATMIYAGFWSFVVPFQYSAISARDKSGNSIMLAPAWQAIGIALGPTLASATALEISFFPSLIMAITAIVLSMMLFFRKGMH